MSDGWATVLVGVVMAVGLAGTVVPLLPGLMLIWGAGLGYGLVVGFGTTGVVVMVALSAIVVASAIKTVLVPRRMAQGQQVSGWSQLAALIGAVVGFFVIPVVGLVIGALAGLLVSEYLHHGRLEPAWRATKAVALGFGVSALIDIGLGLVMITLWGGWALTVLL